MCILMCIYASFTYTKHVHTCTCVHTCSPTSATTHPPTLVRMAYTLQDEWRHLIAGGTTVPERLPNPDPTWLSDRAWSDILSLPALERFGSFAREFPDHAEGFKSMFDSQEPHKYICTCQHLYMHMHMGLERNGEELRALYL